MHMWLGNPIGNCKQARCSVESWSCSCQKVDHGVRVRYMESAIPNEMLKPLKPQTWCGVSCPQWLRPRAGVGPDAEAVSKFCQNFADRERLLQVLSKGCGVMKRLHVGSSLAKEARIESHPIWDEAQLSTCAISRKECRMHQQHQNVVRAYVLVHVRPGVALHCVGVCPDVRAKRCSEWACRRERACDWKSLRRALMSELPGLLCEVHLLVQVTNLDGRLP